jgi:hypothetical protein
LGNNFTVGIVKFLLCNSNYVCPRLQFLRGNLVNPVFTCLTGTLLYMHLRDMPCELHCNWYVSCVTYTISSKSAACWSTQSGAMHGQTLRVCMHTAEHEWVPSACQQYCHGIPNVACYICFHSCLSCAGWTACQWLPLCWTVGHE